MDDKIAQAKQAGYSDSEIINYLASNTDYSAKIAQAKQAGYSDEDIVSHLSSIPSSTAQAPQPATADKPKLSLPEKTEHPALKYTRPTNSQVAMNAVPKGVAAIPDMFINTPTNVLNLGKALVGTVAGAVTGNSDYMPDLTETPNLANKAAHAVGLINPAYEPQDSEQRLIDAGVQGLTAGVLTGGAGALQGGLRGAAVISPTVMGGASGAVGAGTSQAAAELGAPPILSIPAGMIAGGAVLGVPKVASVTGAPLKDVYQEAFKRTPEQRGNMLLQDMTEASGYTPAQLAAKKAEMGDKSILADTSKVLLDIADNAASKVGKTKEALGAFTRNRNKQESSDVFALLSQKFGGIKKEDLSAALEKNAQEMQAKAYPLYKQSLSSNVVNSPLLEQLKASDSFKEAYANSGKYADDVNQVITPNSMSLTGQKPVARQLTEAEKLHNTKLALWDKESSLRKNGETHYANIVGDQRRQLTDVLDTLPGYKEARNTWSGGKGTEEAGNIGELFFKLKKKPDEFIKLVKDLNPHDREVAKMSLMKAASDEAGARPDSRPMAGLLTDGENQRAMLEALTDKQTVEALQKNADKWSNFRNTNNALGNSRTAVRQIVNKEIEKGIELSSPKSAVMNYLYSHLAPNGRRMSDTDVTNYIGEFLGNPNLTQDQIINALTKAPSKTVKQKLSLTDADKKLLLLGAGTAADRELSK